MAKSFKNLREKMSPEAQKRAAVKTRKMLLEMRLDELRRARALSQEKLAETLNQSQAAVSKMERRTDMYISTLRSYIEALGGALEIKARFDDGDVTIKQFGELANVKPSRSGRPEKRT